MPPNNGQIYFNKNKKTTYLFFSFFIFPKFHIKCHAPEGTHFKNKLKLIKPQVSWFTTKLQASSLTEPLLHIINDYTTELLFFLRLWEDGF